MRRTDPPTKKAGCPAFFRLRIKFELSDGDIPIGIMHERFVQMRVEAIQFVKLAQDMAFHVLQFGDAIL